MGCAYDRGVSPRPRPRSPSAVAMAQVDDLLFGKGKREQFYKMKTEGVRTRACWLGAALLLRLRRLSREREPVGNRATTQQCSMRAASHASLCS